MSNKFPAFSRSDLIKATKRDAIITETARQIIKDFGEFSLEITFSGNPGEFYDELYNQMYNHISELMLENTNKFQALLYRIDVSQKDIDFYHRQMPNANYNDILTELIIHRELKKVMIRDYFRSQNNDNITSFEDDEED